MKMTRAERVKQAEQETELAEARARDLRIALAARERNFRAMVAEAQEEADRLQREADELERELFGDENADSA